MTRGVGLWVKPQLTTPKMFTTGKKRCPIAFLKKYLDDDCNSWLLYNNIMQC